MAGKRITFSTATPNDQRGVIPNEVIDFSRFDSNPVLLCQHMWGEKPLGLMTDIRMENGAWTGLPVFNMITEDSKEYAALYAGGWIKACSIGGEAVWETTGKKVKDPITGDMVPEYKLDANGNRTCLKFYLYEISIVTLPSNKDATTQEQLAAKIYETTELSTLQNNIVKFSSQYNSKTMDKTKEELEAEKIKSPETLAAEKLAAEKLEAEKLKTGAKEIEKLAAPLNGTEDLPGVLKNILGFVTGIKNLFVSAPAAPEKEAAPAADKLAGGGPATPAPKNEPNSTVKDPTTPQPKPTGLEAAAAKAEAAVNHANSLKASAEKEGASAEEKASYQSALEAANSAMSALEALETEDMASKKAEKKPDDAEEEGDTEGAKEKTKNSAKPNTKKFEMKSSKEIKETLNLAAAPEHRAKVGKFNTATFTELSSPKNEEGQRILNRVMTSDGGEKEIADYAVVLNSIMQDGKYKAIVEKTRLMMNVDERNLAAYQSKPNSRQGGQTLQHIAAMLNSGTVEMMGRDNVMRPITKLSSSDDALTTPALAAIEWLPLAIFKLFPSASWKSAIPVFGAQETTNNLGLIWANIAADPTITKGAQPVAPADYTYTDDAVALKLVPYWLQPMRWTPLTMHQLRYDQMSTGWAQAFAKWGAVMDDDMIYTLASTVPAASIVSSNGANFSIAGANDPNAFYYNSAFAGNLAKPQLQDIIRLEQIYNKQNFDLGSEKPVLVLDPTADALISMDPDTKSLLTRFVNGNQEELMKFKHTSLIQRSRVAVYDPATSQIKDNEGVIPATSVSACLGFLPSQVGIGLGMLDVFMIQDPSSYGYKMSADIRIGIVPLRKNYDGTTILTYGAANI